MLSCKVYEMATTPAMLSDRGPQTGAGPGYRWPDANGHFGPYGGLFVPETLMYPLEELRVA